VSYDISNDKLRTAFAKLIKKYGRRLQYSVREIKNSTRVLNILVTSIDKIYGPKFEMTDSVVMFTICEGCAPKIKRYGYAVQEEEDLVMT